MKIRVICTRTTITVESPFMPGDPRFPHMEFTRKSGPVQSQIHKAIMESLVDWAHDPRGTKRNVWWNNKAYTVSPPADRIGFRGEYYVVVAANEHPLDDIRVITAPAM